jgi:UDP-N-acetylmuramoylalanine-D-glutamate ligase
VKHSHHHVHEVHHDYVAEKWQVYKEQEELPAFFMSINSKDKARVKSQEPSKTVMNGQTGNTKNRAVLEKKKQEI